jgi:hypothetical protein
MSKHKESRFGFVFLCCLAMYVLMSMAVAIRTDTACGGQNGHRHWAYAPPGWVCD